jgi:hypothetical protein
VDVGKYIEHEKFSGVKHIGLQEIGKLSVLTSRDRKNINDFTLIHPIKLQQ